MEVQESRPVKWVLYSSVQDAKDHVGELTDEEIEYCGEKENRLTVRRILERERNRRIAVKVMEANILP